jgi:uncharacterized membrane protein
MPLVYTGKVKALLFREPGDLPFRFCFLVIRKPLKNDGKVLECAIGVFKNFFILNQKEELSNMKKQGKKTKHMVLMALFIAMSVVGGYIKVPNPITSSIAFDSMPAYLASLIFGGFSGAIVGFLGHVLSAAIGGFPLSLPIHLLIAFQMAIIMIIFNFVAKRYNLIAAVVIGTLLNGVGAPACLILIPNLGMPVFVGAIVPLTITSFMNIILCVFIYRTIKNHRIVKEVQEVNNGL